LDTIHRTKTNKIQNTNIENLFVFVLCIVSNVNSCPLVVVLSVFYVCVVYFVCLRSVYCIQCLQLIENRRDNQEWSAVNIGYNTQNEDKQNTKHKHRKPTVQPAMFVFVLCIVFNVNSCPLLVVLSVFYVCVVYFVCLRYNTQNEEKQNKIHNKNRKLTGQPGMGSCKHWI
jgi:hypothetical protein